MSKKLNLESLVNKESNIVYDKEVNSSRNKEIEDKGII